MRPFIVHIDRSGGARQIVDTLAVVRTEEGKFQCGYAKMSGKDIWNRKLGNKIAVGRAIKNGLECDAPEGAMGWCTDPNMMPCYVRGQTYTEWAELMDDLADLCRKCLGDPR